MSVNISSQLKCFQDYLESSRATGTFNEDTVVQVGENNTIKQAEVTASPLARAFVATDSSLQAFRENNRVRSAFLRAIAQQYQGFSKIPDYVMKALKIDDFGLEKKGNQYAFTSGKPLTMRRIQTVMNAILSVNSISPDSNPPDPVKQVYTGPHVALDFNDEIDPTTVPEPVDEAHLVAQFDEMLEEVGRHAGEFGGAPSFNQTFPRQPHVDDEGKNRFNTARVFQKKMQAGGLKKLAYGIAGAVAGIKTNYTRFESAAMYLDGLRRLANNANFVLREFETKTLDEAVQTFNRYSGLSSHTEAGGVRFSKAALIADIRTCLKSHYYAFKIAQAKGNVGEFIALCAGGACFQDSVSRLKDYLIQNNALVDTDEEFNQVLSNLQNSVQRSADMMRANNGIAILDTLALHTEKTNAGTYVWDEIRAIYETRVAQHVPNAATTPLRWDEVKDFLKTRLHDAVSRPEGLELNWMDPDTGAIGTQTIKDGKVRIVKQFDEMYMPIEPPEELPEQDFNLDDYVENVLREELVSLGKLNPDGTLAIEMLH